MSNKFATDCPHCHGDRYIETPWDAHRRWAICRKCNGSGTRKALVNKYPAKCCARPDCGEAVKAGGGWMVKANGGWRVFHQECPDGVAPGKSALSKGVKWDRARSCA